MTDLEKLKILTATVNEHVYNYYVLDNPTISDAEFDKLYYELVGLEKELGIVLDDSPTKRVGGEVIQKFKSSAHLAKLYSLDKAQSLEELFSWKNRVLKNLEADFSVEYKFDGLTLVLTYDKGEFIKAATRGNGTIGEDVTEQVKTIKSFPLTINYQGLLEVGGEGIMRLSSLKKYNETADEPLKNARNGVAGAIRNLDPKVTAKRKLEIFFYSINYIEQDIIKSQEDVIDFLKDNKFKISPFFKICKNIEEVSEILKEIEKSRDNLDFLIDGAVIKINNFDIRDELGYTEKFPKWAVAYKFEAEEVSTILKDVVWNVGRTGKLTPLALLEPVELSGATVRRATLNNYGDILRKKIKINANVLVRRSNDVIPEILGVMEYYDNCKDIIPLKNCPECNSVLIEDGANIFCKNSLECPPQIIGRLVHFASKGAMDIEGFSEKTAEQLYKVLDIKFPYQLYKLENADLLKLEGFKDKKTENIINSVKNSLNCSLENFIYALGINNIGKKTAKDLTAHFKTLEGLMAADYDKFMQIYEIGEVAAKSLTEYFLNDENLKNLNILLDCGIAFKENKVITNGVFLNETAVITGTFEKYKRSELEKIIVSQGGTVSNTVTKQTTLLICGQNAGSKLDKAKQLKIKIIDEIQLNTLLNK